MTAHALNAPALLPEPPASRQSPPSAYRATLPTPGCTPGSACSPQTPHTDCSGTAAHKCCNPAACRYTACARRRSGSPSPPAHPASAKNSHSTSAADNSPQSAATARSRHPTARSRQSYRTASAPKAAPTAPWRCPRTPSLPAEHILSPSPPGSESNPRAAVARCPPATTPPSPPDPSPPVDCVLLRTVQTAPARSPPAPPVQSSPWSYHSPEHKIRSQACRSEEHTSELQSRQYLVCRL